MNVPVPVVFDCNVYLQAMLSSRGPAHACWQHVLDGDAMLYVTPYIIAEIRALPEHPKLRRFRNLTQERVERFIDEILDVSTFIPNPSPVFSYARDPDDAHYVDVAVATGALLIVSHDKDLLDLMNDQNTDGKSLRQRHPAFRVLTPPQFLATFPPPAQS